MTLRVGIIGAGWIGQWHAARWRQLPVTLAGFYDAHPDTAQQAVSNYGGELFKDASALIRAVDVVQICTPTIYHKQYVLEAAAHHKSIFCEKPLSRTLSDAHEMISACESANVRFFVGHVLRFFPQYIRARQLIEQGAVGKPEMVRLLRAAGHPATSDRRMWLKSVENTGGCMMEGGVHDLDFARWAIGEVDHVFARGLTFRTDLDFPADHGFAVLRFKNGAIGHVEESWMAMDGRFRQQFEISGDQGLIRYDSLPTEQFSLALRGRSGPALLPGEPLSTEDEPYYRQLAHFVDCLLHDRPFLIAPQDGLEAIRLALAILESMRTGKVVKVQDVV